MNRYSLAHACAGHYTGCLTKTLAEIEAAAVTLSPQEIKQLEEFVRGLRMQAEEARLQELYRITGFHPLPRRNNEVVTSEMVNQLRAEENI